MIEQLREKQFLALEAEWNTMNRDGNLFSTHAWMRVWLAHFGTEQHVVLTYREDGKLTAGALFRLNGGVYDQNHEQFPWPWVAADPSLKNPYEPFLWHIHGVRGASKVKLVQAAAESSGSISAVGGYHCISTFARNSRGVDVSTSFAEYEKALKKKVRAELHRRDRHLREAIPSAELVRHDDPVEEFEIIAAVERDSWKEHEHTAIISSPRESDFYRALLALDEPGMSPRLYSIDTDDGPIAYVIGILHGGVLYALKTSFQQRHAKLSPGSVLFYRALEEICDDEPEVKQLELLGNDAQWKRHLSTYNRELFNHMLLKDSLSNRAYVYAWTRVRPAVKGHRILGPIYEGVRKRLVSDSQ